MEIKGHFDHFNINVVDLERSIAFYNKALGLREIRRKEAEDGSFILVYLGDGFSSFLLELTCIRVEGDYDEARRFHKEMGCICYENTDMGLYFIHDPDDYWIEILPVQ